jgi:hypothetical protein
MLRACLNWPNVWQHSSPTRIMLQLREKDRQALKAALGAFPEVRHVWVFGSRATGKARRASDIDIAIEAPGLSPARWHLCPSGYLCPSGHSPRGRAP